MPFLHIPLLCLSQEHFFFHTEEEESDADLRYAVANMVAVILGCNPRSNHLWYHLFEQQPLYNTYLTGFMYDRTVRGLHYDCGVELTHEGQLGRVVYAGRWHYNLHFLYFMLFVNFGSFCVALLTQPEAKRNIHGPLISAWQPVRHYCVSQLRTLWVHIQTNLKLSKEEPSFLIMSCFKRFYEVCFNDGQ